jgi:hypothetical protein
MAPTEPGRGDRRATQPQPGPHLGADLLVTAYRSAEVTGDGQSEFVFQHRAGRSGRVEVVLAQHEAVVVGRCQQFDLLVVVGDHADVSLQCRQFVSVVGSVLLDLSSVRAGMLTSVWPQ